MAADWIQWEKGLYGKREIRGTASRLNISVAEACLLWMKFWEWTDTETIDGTLHEVNEQIIDDIVHHQGFAAVAVEVGWLFFGKGGEAKLPNYDRHNTTSAKARIQAAERKRRQRAKEKVGDVT